VIAAMHDEAKIVCLPIVTEVTHTTSIERRQLPFDATDDTSFAEQQIRDKCAVFTTYTCSKRNTLNHIIPLQRGAKEKIHVPFAHASRPRLRGIIYDSTTLTGLPFVGCLSALRPVFKLMIERAWMFFIGTMSSVG
jgi:hypothetical protein